jgi:Protein of unknown function (DUF3489)
MVTGNAARQMRSTGATMTKKKSVSTKAQPVDAGMGRPKQQPRKAKSKLEQLEVMLRRPDGATVDQIGKALHWQKHSVRGAMSGALKKKQGLTITSEKTQDGRRIYRIAA